MSNGKIKVKSTPYRDGQNVIRDSRTKAIIYLPNGLNILLKEWRFLLKMF